MTHECKRVFLAIRRYVEETVSHELECSRPGAGISVRRPGLARVQTAEEELEAALASWEAVADG